MTRASANVLMKSPPLHEPVGRRQILSRKGSARKGGLTSRVDRDRPPTPPTFDKLSYERKNTGQLEGLGMSGDMTKLVQDSLIREVEELSDQIRTLAKPLTEKQFWTKPLEPSNSIGHLVLHLTGNLSHFVGAL